MTQLLLLLAVPSVSISIPVSEPPSTSEESQSEDWLIKEQYVQESNADESRRMCLKEFGNLHFCDCILDEKVISSNFPAYLQIATHPSNTHGYSDSTYDKILEIQKKCTMELR
jgi:hypothetical protein